MKAVILASGRDDSWSLGSAPPELVPVVNRPLIRHQLAALGEAGIREAAIVASDVAAAAIERVLESGPPLGVRVVYVPARPGTGEARALLAAEAFLSDGPFVVQLGSTLVLHDIRATVELLGARHLHAVVVEPGRQRANGLAAGAAPAAECPGLFMLDCAIFPALRENVEQEPEIGMAELMNARALRVERQTATGWSKRIDGLEDLLEVNERVLDRTPPSYAPESLHESSIQGPVMIERGARIEFSALRGPVAIAAGAHVADAHIGPYTCIGAWAQVERVETERCVILGGASVENLGARLEASVIGEKAHVSRNFGLPRALRLRIGEGAHLSLL